MKQVLTVPLELKALDEREFTGHGSIFRNVDLGGDVVVPGAFRKSLADHRRKGTLPQMFWMHDPSRVPGKWIEMQEDDNGLAVRGVLAETDLGEELRTLMRMKAVRGLSIGYLPVERDYDSDGNRLLREVDLWEVSIVSLAMNPLARIESIKSRLSRDGEYVPTIREFERSLRDVGCSSKTAKTIVAKLFDEDDSDGMSGGHLRDAGSVEEEATELTRAVEAMTASMFSAALRR